MEPGSNQYGTTPLETMRAAGALLAAGAWDATPLLEIACIGMNRLTAFVSYEQGAAGGTMDFTFEVSPYSADQVGVLNWYQMSLYEPGSISPAPCVEAQSRIQREYVTFCPATANEEGIVFTVDLAVAVERIRCRCRESGNIANPGNAHVVGLFMVI